MQIIFKKNFVKQYKKLKKADQKCIEKTLLLFEKNPTDIRLKNHALKGRLEGKNAISARYDLRIIFSIEGDYIVVNLLAVGSHNQVY